MQDEHIYNEWRHLDHSGGITFAHYSQDQLIGPLEDLNNASVVKLPLDECHWIS